MRIVRDNIAELVLNPDKAKIKDELQNTLGEFNNIEYKEDWENYSKLSKHILAFANSGGGLVIVGVKQDNNGQIIPVGLEKFTDKADVFKGVKKYIPTILEFDVLDLDYPETEYASLKGKKLQIVSISYTPNYLPFISARNGESILENKIYVRKGTQSIEASYEDLQKILNVRINTGSSSSVIISLDEHLKQLRILYEEANKYVLIEPLIPELVGMEALRKKNPKFPKQNYYDFLGEIIEQKKEVIRNILSR